MPGKPGPKPKIKTLVVTLNLPSQKLADFPSKDASSSSSAPPATPAKDSSKDGTPALHGKESTPAVPTPGGLEVPQRKKPGPPKGTKRKVDALLPDGTPKPRGKPGPKKRKLDGDETTRPWTTPAGPAAHKLGPKANQGAINAGLRALDRSGKPCRKWGKRTFSVKTFTGQAWSLPCWGAPKKPTVKAEGDNEEGAENVTASNSDIGNTPGINGGPNGQTASSDAGASGVEATPNGGTVLPAAGSPAPTETPIEAAA